MKTELRKRFANSKINTVHQTGQAITEAKTGVNVVVYLIDSKPNCAEVYSDDCEEYAEIGLEMEGKRVAGYDGVFDLPGEVISLLEENGFDCTEVK